MERKITLLSILLVAFFFQPSLYELNSESIQTKKDQKALQHEVTVTLKLVQVYVTDKQGNPVTDLTKDDFILYDNGKLQTITDLEKHFLAKPKKKEEKLKETKLPPSREIPSRMNRKFIFLFATGGISGISKSKKAAHHFIDTQIQPTDEVGVMSYSWLTGFTLHEYLTSNMEKVKKAIKEIKGFQGPGIRGSAGMTMESERTRAEAGAKRPEGFSLKSFSTYIPPEKESQISRTNDFINGLKELAKSMRYIPGNKNVIFFSDGIPRSFLFGGFQTLRENYEDMGKEFAASNSPVHAVSMIGPGIEESLQMLSELSGGQYFHTVDYYEKIAEQIQSFTSNYYVLGYYIDEKWDGKYHEIKVEVKRKRCEAHAQGGYFNPKPFTEYTEFEKQLHLIDLALGENPYFQEPLNFNVMALPFSEKKESNFVLLSKIPQDKIPEVTEGKTELITFIFDTENNIVASTKGKINFSQIPQKTIYHYAISSISAGQYECRVVIRNLETGNAAVASTSVIIPEQLDSGIRLYPPLLLIPEKEAFYLRASETQKEKKEGKALSIIDIYPLLSKRHSPLVEDLEQGITKILGVIRCSVAYIQKPNIELSAYLIDHSSGQKTLLSFSILSSERTEDTDVLFIEIQLPELKPGKYYLEITAEEIKSKSRSEVRTSLNVK